MLTFENQRTLNNMFDQIYAVDRTFRITINANFGAVYSGGKTLFSSNGNLAGDFVLSYVTGYYAGMHSSLNIVKSKMEKI